METYLKHLIDMRNLIFFFLLIISPFTLYLIAGNNSSKDVSYKISLGKVYHTAIFHDSLMGCIACGEHLLFKTMTAFFICIIPDGPSIWDGHGLQILK